MFAVLEKSLKNEMERIHRNLGHILERVEEVEKISESNSIGMRKLEAEIKSLKIVQQEQAYKLEDQESRDRRKNLRIRGVPETSHQEDLIEIIKKICNPLMNKETTNPIKIERAHRLKRPRELPQENPRDIIVRFKNWEDKNQLWQNLRGKSPIEHEGNHIQFFQNLSQETLKRRRTLKPLLAIPSAIQLGLPLVFDRQEKWTHS